MQYLHMDPDLTPYLVANVAAGSAGVPASYECWLSPDYSTELYIYEAVGSLSLKS